jgi:hypothetical protein
MPLSQGQLQTPTNSSQALSNGIATAEGYLVAGSTPNTANNPGDLKNGDIGYGETNGVTNYPTPEAGFAALNSQVQLIQSGASKAGYTTDMSIMDVAQLYTGGDSINGAGSTQNWSNTVANTVNNYNGGQNTITSTSNFAQTAQGVVNPSGTNPPIPPNTTTVSSVNPLQDLDPADYVPVAGQDISDADVAELTPSYVIQDASLDANPWYKDKELPNTHKSLNAQYPSPITFQIELPSSAQSGNAVSYLSNSSGQPIVIELNVSMKSLNTTSKHIIHKNPTRTGMHITFWGMQPDVIVGEGTTGAFFNQMGLANFMSTAAFTGALQTQILQLLNQSKPIPQLSVVIENNGQVTSTAQANQVAFQKSQAFGGNPIAASEGVRPAVSPNNRKTLQKSLTSEALRVAAQDAFQELLMLFKENGVIYFHPSNYKGFTDGSEQSSPTAWSPSTGTSSFEMNARNNDVMARGKVAMKFKSSVYLGYFKAFSWTQDADHPFLWNFNFTFQVESTMTLVYYPQSAGTVASAPGNS